MTEGQIRMRLARFQRVLVEDSFRGGIILTVLQDNPEASAGQPADHKGFYVLGDPDHSPTPAT
jgi:hypothetical protein